MAYSGGVLVSASQLGRAATREFLWQRPCKCTLCRFLPTVPQLSQGSEYSLQLQGFRGTPPSGVQKPWTLTAHTLWVETWTLWGGPGRVQFPFPQQPRCLFLSLCLSALNPLPAPPHLPNELPASKFSAQTGTPERTQATTGLMRYCAPTLCNPSSSYKLGGSSGWSELPCSRGEQSTAFRPPPRTLKSSHVCIFGP